MTFNKLEYQKEYKKNKQKQGLCLSCGILPAVTKTWCGGCRQKRNFHSKEIYKKDRIIALDIYGNKCACCGETTKEFLQIDHIDSSGAVHRRKIKRNIYMWLRQNNYPKDNFQILCANCNWSKGKYGYCPHKSMMFGEGK